MLPVSQFAEGSLVPGGTCYSTLVCTHSAPEDNFFLCVSTGTYGYILLARVEMEPSALVW